jgi:hypothetical protein
LSARETPPYTTVPFLCPDGVLRTISLGPEVSAYTLQPLDSRAWAFQEYLLSPRLLMYGSSELTWHCQSYKFQPVWKSHLLYNTTPIIRLPDQVFQDTGFRVEPDEAHLRDRLWSKIVQDYSSCHLTYSDDGPLPS